MGNFRVELNTVHLLRLLLNSDKGGSGGLCDGFEAFGDLRQLVAVTHPHYEVIGKIGEKTRTGEGLDFCFPVFALVVWGNGALVCPCDLLKTVTDTKDGNIERPDCRVDVWCIGVIYRVGTTGEDDTW